MAPKHSKGPSHLTRLNSERLAYPSDVTQTRELSGLQGTNRQPRHQDVRTVPVSRASAGQRYLRHAPKGGLLSLLARRWNHLAYRTLRSKAGPSLRGDAGVPRACMPPAAPRSAADGLTSPSPLRTGVAMSQCGTLVYYRCRGDEAVSPQAWRVASSARLIRDGTSMTSRYRITACRQGDLAGEKGDTSDIETAPGREEPPIRRVMTQEDAGGP